MFYFYPFLVVEVGVRNDSKRVSRMRENAYLSIKNPNASRALKQGPRPCLQMAHFGGTTTLASFGLKKLPPPPPAKSRIRTWIGKHTL